MDEKGIKSYKELEIFYREKQKSIWREITTTKKAIYWANEEIDLPVQSDDVIQWWGVSKNVDALKGRKNEIILSNYDLLYLDVGVGNRYGSDYGTYITWRKMYSFSPHVDTVNVIGAETCMWSELNNKHTHDQKIWIRTSILAERLWNSKISLDQQLVNIVKRLVAQKNRLKSRGFKPSIVSVELCERTPAVCFS